MGGGKPGRPCRPGTAPAALPVGHGTRAPGDKCPGRRGFRQSRPSQSLSPGPLCQGRGHAPLRGPHKAGARGSRGRVSRPDGELGHHTSESTATHQQHQSSPESVVVALLVSPLPSLAVSFTSQLASAQGARQQRERSGVPDSAAVLTHSKAHQPTPPRHHPCWQAEGYANLSLRMRHACILVTGQWRSLTSGCRWPAGRYSRRRQSPGPRRRWSGHRCTLSPTARVRSVPCDGGGESPGFSGVKHPVQRKQHDVRLTQRHIVSQCLPAPPNRRPKHGNISKQPWGSRHAWRAAVRPAGLTAPPPPCAPHTCTESLRTRCRSRRGSRFWGMGPQQRRATIRRSPRVSAAGGWGRGQAKRAVRGLLAGRAGRTDGAAAWQQWWMGRTGGHPAKRTTTAKPVEVLVQPWPDVHTDTVSVQLTAPYGLKGLTSAWWRTDGERRGEGAPSAARC
jgi:hypothetical protein